MEGTPARSSSARKRAKASGAVWIDVASTRLAKVSKSPSRASQIAVGSRQAPVISFGGQQAAVGPQDRTPVIVLLATVDDGGQQQPAAGQRHHLPGPKVLTRGGVTRRRHREGGMDDFTLFDGFERWLSQMCQN